MLNGVIDDMKVQSLRTFSRILLIVFMTAHMIAWYALGIHVLGSIGIEALYSGLSRGVLNAGFVFWVGVFVVTLLFGRAFCGWFCWFGGYLDLVQGLIDKLKIRIPSRPLLYLGAIPFAALFAKLYNSLLVNWLEDFPSTLTFRLADMEPWGGQQTGISILITLVLFGPVLLYVFGKRAWCRYLCPIGALVKGLGRLGLGKIRLTNNECIGCGICNRACHMQVDVLGELRANGEVRSLDCIRCFKCTDECPKGAISLNLVRGNASLSTDTVTRAVHLSSMRRSSSTFDKLVAGTWVSITMIFTFFGISQNVPQEVKVTMSAGLLLVICGFVLLLHRISGFKLTGSGFDNTNKPKTRRSSMALTTD
ncbi:MAG: 4Fe-4S binding protein [archaeon]